MLRVGVIGCGAMGQNHARVYSEVASLVGVCDVSREAARAVGDRLGVPHFTDHRELLRQELDAVSVATPTLTHHRIALDVLSSGRHILVEKPICGTLREAREVIAAAEERGLTLVVGHIERYNPVVQFLKRAVEARQLGRVLSMAARRVSPGAPRIGDVGVVLDLATHDIDVMRYLSGSEVDGVYALGGSSGGTRHEDHASILIHFRSGVSGFVEVNWLTPTKVRRLTLTCSGGVVEADYIGQSVQISTSVATEVDPSNLFQTPQEFDVKHIFLKKREPLRSELLDFLGAIAEGRKPIVTGEDGLRALELAQAALLSLKEGRKVELPL
ncbi:MAG: Gfo/Idh/MocA family oxidoreductase [Thermoplasmatota archaeon]